MKVIYLMSNCLITILLILSCATLSVAEINNKAGGMKLVEKAQVMEKLPVIIRLNIPYYPEGQLSLRQEREDQHARISQAQGDLLERYSGRSISKVKKFMSVPYIAMTVDASGLADLLNDPEIVSIQEDIPVPPTLEQSIPFINADTVHSEGSDGTGYAVAVLDTGVRNTHTFLDAGKIVSEACYSTTYDPYASTTVCPNGLGSQEGPGAGVNCLIGSSCSHGTHVAGIAAGTGGIPGTGVAPGADIIAIQVFSRFDNEALCGVGLTPCILSYSSDQMLGLERVYLLRNTLNIAAVNMSIGGGVYSGYCDTDPRKLLIDNLRSAGISTVISSGNDAFDGSVGAPGCISSAVTVGATLNDSDSAAYFSNHAYMVDLMAPGYSINSSTATSDTSYASWSGTSMAAPHVAGAFAVMKDRNSFWTVDEMENLLKSTGANVTRAGITIPRIDLHAAAADRYEENDTRETAYDLSFRRQSWLNTIDGYGFQEDDDWYEIGVEPGFERIQIDLRFSHADGDVNLQLVDSLGYILISSATVSDNEFIDYTVSAGAGIYYLRVHGDGAGNPYTLWWDALVADIGPAVSNPFPANGSSVPPGATGQLLRVVAPGSTGGTIHYGTNADVPFTISASVNGDNLEAVIPYAAGEMESSGTNYWYIVAEGTGGSTRYPQNGNLSFSVADKSFPWTLFLPAIGRSNISEWGVGNFVCCSGGWSSFNLTADGTTNHSILSSCSSSSSSWEGWQETTAKTTNFNWTMTSKNCGSVGGSFSYELEPDKQYFFYAVLKGSTVEIRVSVYNNITGVDNWELSAANSQDRLSDELVTTISSSKFFTLSQGFSFQSLEAGSE